MEYIKAFFIIWGSIVGLGTLAGLFKFRKSWDNGVVISGGVNLLYALLTIGSALDIIVIPTPDWWAWTIAPVGLMILSLGQGLGIWAARELKQNFSPKLVPTAEGSLITTGPFQICRHPIMLSMLMSWIGTGIALNSIMIFVLYGLVAIAIMKRVALEEKLLEEKYGEQFQHYKLQTTSIVPFLDPSSKANIDLESAINLMKDSNWKEHFCFRCKLK